jgi:hypothetical protein
VQSLFGGFGVPRVPSRKSGESDTNAEKREGIKWTCPCGLTAGWRVGWKWSVRWCWSVGYLLKTACVCVCVCMSLEIR